MSPALLDYELTTQFTDVQKALLIKQRELLHLECPSSEHLRQVISIDQEGWSLCLRMIGGTAHMAHLLGFQEVSQFLRHIGRTVIAQKSLGLSLTFALSQPEALRASLSVSFISSAFMVVHSC